MLRDWRLKISVQRDLGVPLHLQIVQAIIEKIRAGLLRPGVSLPGSRELAESLQVNRKTVVLAFDELVAQGWLATQHKRGTFVATELPVVLREGKATVLPSCAASLPAPAYGVYGVEKPLPALAPKDTIEFSDGAPDTRVIPFGVLSGAFRRALIETARGNQLGYGDPRGLAALRRLLAEMLRAERELNADEETLCLVRGSQMGIYLAARLLVRPGDVVALERLSYPPARDAFRAAGATVVNIAQDEEGMMPESLEQACRTQGIRAVYTTPHHQFPTTVTMSRRRRMQLLELAEQYDFAIVEDDYDHEFHYTHNPMLPLASSDAKGRVIYIGSLSKILAPGLRMGYVAAPRAIVNRLANEIMLIDRQGNAVTEHAVADLMRSGELKRHIRRAVRVYEARRTLAMALVQEKLAPYATCKMPAGGLALWLALDDKIDMRRLERDAASVQLKIRPASLFSDGDHTANALRLGFGNLDERELQSGFERLRHSLLRQPLDG